MKFSSIEEYKKEEAKAEENMTDEQKEMSEERSQRAKEKQTEFLEKSSELQKKRKVNIEFLHRSETFSFGAYQKENIKFFKENGFDHLIEKLENGEESIRVLYKDIKKVAEEIPQLYEELYKMQQKGIEKE